MQHLLRIIGSLCLILLSSQGLRAQYHIAGSVSNETGEQPLEFATVSLLQATDSSVVTGTVTDAKGTFELQATAGTYLLKTGFLGFNDYFSEPITLAGEQLRLEWPAIRLQERSMTLDVVEIAGEKSLVEFSLDKKIFNVGQDLSNRGATASEILSNIPSVTVDPEGNVKLRGSADVRILIDGKPSGLTRANGLRQLQGSLIESVEVITNPSARYEAEGNAGIINIILKKEKKQGLNGSFELLMGTPTNHGVSANVNYRYKKLNFFVNYSIAYRVQPNIGTLYQEVYANDTTFVQEQSRDGYRQGINNNVRGGIDYYFNDQNILTGSYRFQRSDGKRFTDLRYEDYLFNTENLISTSLRDQYEEESEPYSEYVLSYKRLFSKKGHEFNADVRYLNYWENSDQQFTEITFLPTEKVEQGVISRQNSINDEYEDQYLIQVDYTQPIGKEGKFEAGWRSSFRDMTNDYLATEQNDLGEWNPIEGFDNIFIYQEDIHAVYGILGNKGKKFSYQAGLRVEMTDVETLLKETNERNPRDYTNFFPSAHLSWHLPAQNDMQISYSRRVRRPQYGELSPFVTLADGRNFFSGNPDLNPEYTDAFEVGHLKYFEKGSLSSALYYRYSTGTIQSIRRVDEQGFSTRLPENLKDQHAFGAEMALGYNLYSWWKLDANFNFYRAITDGTNVDATFNSDTYSWFVRQVSKFTLPKQFSIQLRGNYDAPELTPQGRRKSLYYFDIAIQKELWDRKGRLTLNAMDVLNSRKMRSIFEGETFYTEQMTQFQRRQINLTLSYQLKP